MSIEIVIDGSTCSCEPGEFLATVAARNNIYIPTLCASKEALAGRGCCRICVVEVVEQGYVKVVASCIYPITQACEVFTKSERIQRERGVLLALLRCLAPDAEFAAGMAAMQDVQGVQDTPFYEQLDALGEKGSRCILCGLCVEACKTLGSEAIATVGRGIAKKVSTPYNDPSSACTGCGSCAAVCPTNNIPVETTDKTRTIWGREFELVTCEVCGESLGTVESLAFMETLRTAAGEEGGKGQPTLCSKHRLQQIARELVVAKGVETT